MDANIKDDMDTHNHLTTFSLSRLFFWSACKYWLPPSSCEFQFMVFRVDRQGLRIFSNPTTRTEPTFQTLPTPPFICSTGSKSWVSRQEYLSTKRAMVKMMCYLSLVPVQLDFMRFKSAIDDCLPTSRSDLATVLSLSGCLYRSLSVHKTHPGSLIHACFLLLQAFFCLLFSEWKVSRRTQQQCNIFRGECGPANSVWGRQLASNKSSLNIY